nr:MAG TPA: Oleosin [Caudoviricetes sp.]
MFYRSTFGLLFFAPLILSCALFSPMLILYI